MLDTVNRHLILPLIARKRGSRHLQYLKQLDQMQYDSPEVVQARQLEALQAQLRHAYDTVPYYQRTWKVLGLHPTDVKSLADLQNFPVLTKSDIRQHNDELLSSAYRGQKFRWKTTSGSTGVPLKIALDETAAQWKTAATIRADQWSGWKLGQRVAKVWGNPEYRHFGWKGRLTNAIVDRAVYLDTIHLNSERIQEFVQILRKHRPGMIFGHAHSLYLLATAMKKSGVQDVRPNGIISTAMPLHHWQRTVIEEVFGVPATNRYGCEEVSLIACECEQHAGLHITAESVYAEVLTDQPGEVETGPLLLTDLWNRAMPLIRYQIGDVVSRRPNVVCRCGRGLPIIDSIEGREADYVVTPAGNLISGISLTENFAMHITGAAQVQLIQETRTLLRVRLVQGPEFTPASEQQVAELVLSTFGPTMEYQIEYCDLIPQEPSGKYRFCISKVAHEFTEALSA